VDRNRLKRRLREIGRTRLLPALEGRGAHVDVLVRARSRAYGAPFDRLALELASVLEEMLCSFES